MTTTDFIAAYAAALSTAIFVWGIFKWVRPERVWLSGTTAAGSSAINDQKSYVSLRVHNRGHVACEVNQMGVFVYSSLFDYWRGKLKESAIVVDPMGSGVPFRLEAGATHWGLWEQTPELEELSRGYRIYMGIRHSRSSRPFLVRLQPITSRLWGPTGAKHV